jgi:two-component system chemotaxis sensor kinase CheA
MRSKRLSRQLKKIIGVEDITSESLGFENEAEPSLNESHAQILKNLPAFLDQVDINYEQSDKMVELSNRSLEISTKELSSANDSLIRLNATVNAMINSLNEGFIVFDKDGCCTSISSKKSIEFLKLDPFEKTICQAFNIPHEEQVLFMDWYNYLFHPNFDFHEWAATGPQRLIHDTLYISIKYNPMHKDGELVGVIVILTDITSEIDSAQRAEKFMYKAEMITKFYANQKMFMQVIDLYKKAIEDFKSYVYDVKVDVIPKSEIVRTLHTLKGCAGAMYMMELSKLCDQLETSIKKNWTDDLHLSAAKDFVASISNSLESALTEFYKANKELLGTLRTSKVAESKNIPFAKIDAFCCILKDQGSSDLVNNFVDLFFTSSFEELLLPFETMGYSTAKKQNKEIQFVLNCDPHLKVFPEAYKDFLNSFVHIVNNAIDHGIEDAETRMLMSKDLMGTITMDAHILKNKGEDDKIILKVMDDGGGIDPQKIRAKLSELGQQDINENDEQVIMHIFDLGFSTQDVVSEISGRGVGLNAVMEDVTKLGGKIKITSEIGKGTTFTFELPLILPEANEETRKIVKKEYYNN